MLDGVGGRGIAGLALPALVDRDHAELDLGALDQAHHLHLQRLVAGGRAEVVHKLPVALVGLPLLDDVVGDGGAAVAGRGRPPNVGGFVVVIRDGGGARFAGLI